MKFWTEQSRNVFTRGLKKALGRSNFVHWFEDIRHPSQETSTISPLKRNTAKTCIQALIVLMFSAGLAFAVNALRSQGLPLVMPFPPEYQCPSLAHAGRPLKVAQALKSNIPGQEDTVFVDARPHELFEIGHIRGAINVPYSFIEPTPKEIISRLKRFRTIIIYCNTKDSEESELMAGELSQAGVEGVFYLEGGFLEWVREGGKYTGQRPEQYE
jgi:rhodanese-related sulfurtransferase